MNFVIACHASGTRHVYRMSAADEGGTAALRYPSSVTIRTLPACTASIIAK